MDVTLEIRGFELFGHHGILPEEREKGQVFVYDVTLVAPDTGARTNNLDETIDFFTVAECIREISDNRQFHLIEAIAVEIADTLVSRFDVSRAKVRVRKPDVRLGPVEFTAATVERVRR